ncbi:AMP phosphorylase [Candidatus Woesearchaeota archaeon]|nr:AMP phosphorylase [Candidatus Woesearchaeota archaeon]
MKLKVKDLDISTGGPLIAILNWKDSSELDLHYLDRIKIIKGKKIETVTIDIAQSKKMVSSGRIGLFEEVLQSLNLKDGDIIKIIPARKPTSIDYIKKKLDGFKLDKKEIEQIVWDIVNNKLSDIELTYFVAACYANELDLEETTILTNAMAKYGNTLKLKRYPIMDKHSVGGVAGNRTTMIIVPIIAAAGLTIPKTSSRSITSPAGTADTVEVLTNVNISINKMKRIVEKTNGCLVWGGGLDLAPADDKIIKVEKPLAIDAKSQLLASVMAKKASVSATHLLVDIPSGKGSKISSKEKARKLKGDFISLGKELRIKVRVIITDGKEPIGNGIGPALEARDVLWILGNDKRGPKDLRMKALKMAGLMLEMGGKAGKGNGFKLALDILKSGKAYKKIVEIIKAQGGREVDPDGIELAPVTYDYSAYKDGVIKEISNRAISKTARVAGAPQDKGAGIYLRKHVGDKVKKGEALFTIYAPNKDKLDYVKDVIKAVDGVVIR